MSPNGAAASDESTTKPHSASTSHQDHSPEPTRLSTTPRFISQLLPVRPSQSTISPQRRHDDGPPSQIGSKAATRLSHPLPPPPSTALLSSPVSKRPRIAHDQTIAANGSTGSKRLSEMTRPFSMASPSYTWSSHSSVPAQTTPLKPLRQPSVQEFQSLLPPQPSPSPLAARSRLRYDLEGHALNKTAVICEEEPSPRLVTVPWKSKHILSGFSSLDREFKRISQLERMSRQTSLETPRMHEHHLGLPSGSLLEILGPPGSGKSKVCIQIAVTERLRSLLQARSDLSAVITTNESTTARPESTTQDTELFAEEFWDAEMTSADETLLIDCEGAIQPESVSDAVWSVVSTHWQRCRPQHALQNEVTQRANAPEVVRNLVAAILSGIHLSRATTPAELVALLFRLRPSDDLDQAQGSISANIPALRRPSLIIVDSLSHLLRISGNTAKERKQAVYISELLQHSLLRLQVPFQRQMNAVEDTSSSLSICAPTIVFTNQLGVRRAKQESSGQYQSSRGKAKGGGREVQEGGSMLVPQLQGQQVLSESRAQDRRPGPSVALAGPEIWDDDSIASPLRGTRTDAHMGHDRGWPPSFLGQEVWRILLFRYGTFGQRAAQVISIPSSTHNDLNRTWEQAKRRGAEDGDGTNPEATSDTQELMKNLEEIKKSLFRWRAFTIDTSGLVEESPIQSN